MTTWKKSGKICIPKYITFERNGKIVAKVDAELDVSELTSEYELDLVMKSAQRGSLTILLPME